jgi:hypothetical protein
MAGAARRSDASRMCESINSRMRASRSDAVWPPNTTATMQRPSR